MEQPKPSRSTLRLRISATAETLIRRGHPWLFADSVREANRDGTTGELAVLFDRNDKFLAVGLFDAASPIRVRVLHVGKPQTIDREFWSRNLAEALSKRSFLADQDTTGYRCVNGESDGWPGLVLDRYDTTFVVKIYTAAWLPRLNEIANVISEQTRCERLVLRLSRNIQADARNASLSDGQILRGGPLSGVVVFKENGVRFEAEVLRGQKTGFFLDQRDNRKIVQSLAARKNVLNAFSFSGGFSLYAAHGGALSVTDLDISAHALASAQRNFALNSENKAVAACRHHTIQADVFEWLQHKHGSLFDVIILDPPSLAKREAERIDAIRAYGKLAEGGLAHLAPGGVLVAASCSAHVSSEEFFNVVRQAARGSGRAFSELRTTGHAPDHPARFKEAEYLKCIYLQF